MSRSRRVGEMGVFKSVLIVVGMFGFGYALVPLYDVFCDLTGLNGNTTGVKTAQAANYSIDESRLVKVQFISHLNQSLHWEFFADTFEIEVHPGKVYTTHFTAKNLKPEMVIGQAVPSVMPAVASLHFTKTECFCFINQVFEAGEERKMPVSFVVSPSLPKAVTTLTLAYTFFDVTSTASSPSQDHPAQSGGG